jgi:hypothetical protein
MEIIKLFGAAFGLTYLLWVFFIAVMNIKRVSDAGKLTPFAKALATPVALLGIAIDIATNVLVFTFVLLEFPKEPTVTARLKRHHKESTGWRLS